MDSSEFRKHGHEAIEAIARYMEEVNDYPVLSQVKPNYLRPLLPDEAPKSSESFDVIIKDFHDKIMPGITHWQSGNFFAYFQTGFSYPSFLGEMYCSMLGTLGFNWIASPASTELERVMMDWIAKLIGLGEEFQSQGKGGGVIEGSASDAVFVVMVAARERMLNHIKATQNLESKDIVNKLVAYVSDQATKILGLKCHILPTDDTCVLQADVLAKAIEEDIKAGLIPFYVTASIGTTSTGAVDNIPGIVQACATPRIWVHVDAAYAGSAMVCPEFRHHIAGVEDVDSFDFNLHKWLLVHFDCSCLFVKKRSDITNALSIRPYYLRYKELDQGLVENLDDYQIPLGRRFRALKVWFTLRSYGQAGLQSNIRHHVQLAQNMKAAVEKDPRFEVVNTVHFSLVGLRLSPTTCVPQSIDNETDGALSEKVQSITNRYNAVLYERINQSGIFVTKSDLHGKTFIRMSICGFNTTQETVDRAWGIIQTSADHVLSTSQDVVMNDA
ncbi:hypothetical protein IWQ61_007514 [Dispira simplex]|nr:hypothetical protein IWQ61_007514 [Dispira simplex]